MKMYCTIHCQSKKIICWNYTGKITHLVLLHVNSWQMKPFQQTIKPEQLKINYTVCNTEINACKTALHPISHTKGCSPSWELELRPLGVATGNALSVTRSEDTYVKTPPVGRRQPMTSLPACHNISAAGRIHHQLFRLHWLVCWKRAEWIW